jgi:hypothetical protein
MSNAPPRINVAILAVPEVTAFATYAMYDLFAGPAGIGHSLPLA